MHKRQWNVNFSHQNSCCYGRGNSNHSGCRLFLAGWARKRVEECRSEVFSRDGGGAQAAVRREAPGLQEGALGRDSGREAPGLLQRVLHHLHERPWRQVPRAGERAACGRPQEDASRFCTRTSRKSPSRPSGIIVTGTSSRPANRKRTARERGSGIRTACVAACSCSSSHFATTSITASSSGNP